MSENSKGVPAPQEKLGTLKGNLKAVGEQMRQVPIGSDQKGFAELLEKQEQLEGEIQKLQDSIIPDPGHGVVSQYSISSANRPER